MTEVVKRPKNYDKIVLAAKEMLRDMQASKEKTQLEKYEPLWFAKLRELALLLFKTRDIKRCMSFRDLWDDMSRIVMLVGKPLTNITEADLKKLLDRYFRDPENYSFYFPARQLEDVQDSHRVGACDLHSFKQLPSLARKGIAQQWRHQYRHEYYPFGNTLAKYREERKKDTYFCVEVKALGFFKAIETATELANQSLNVLKCFYLVNHPKLTKCYYSKGQTWIGGLEDFTPFRMRSSYYRVIPEIEEHIKTVTRFIRSDESHEIAERSLLAIDIYGMIEEDTPVPLKFLLSVIAIESLLLSRDDRDFLGWKLREKVAILLGDTPGWLREFLKKDKLTEEEYEKERVAARAELAKRVGRMYDKRSGIAHPKPSGNDEKVTEDDFQFASMIFRFSIQRILSLYTVKKITRVGKTDTIDEKSLDSFIESLKYSVPSGWQTQE